MKRVATFSRRVATLLAIVAAPAGCAPLSRDAGSFEVFVAGRDVAAFDTLAIEVLDGGERVASDSDAAADFPGSFRFESAPAGEFRLKVAARTGAVVVLEAPGAIVRVSRGGTTGRWVRLHERPFEDDDGDLARNGEDPCPLLANEDAADGDGDGTADDCDVCPLISDPAQTDTDGDGEGDACEVPDPGDPQPFAPVRALFASRCALATCHGSVAPQAGLTLTEAAAYGSIVDVASAQEPALDRVEPGDAAASYLFRKISGGAFSEGASMPPTPLEPLSQAEQDLVERWIADGAVP